MLRRVCPDPFVLAIGLTLVTAVMVVVFTDHGVMAAIDFWQDGFWSLLAFSMQMCLILVTGHALASSPPVAAAIRALADRSRSPVGAAVLVAAVAMTLGLVNWGLGLVAGALLARDVGRSLARRGIPHDYPLLAAAGYLGLLVWHGGLSGSAPLKVTREDQVQEIFSGLDVTVTTMPFTETVLSPFNLVVTAGIVLIALAVVAVMAKKGRRALPDEATPEPFSAPASASASRLERSPLVTILLAAPMAVWLTRFFVGGDPWSRLTPNEVNLLFLMLGLLLHGTPGRYVAAVNEAVRGCGGIILQFPLYAGIMGMMASSGLTGLLAGQAAALAGERTLPLVTFVSAGVVNIFVPSGGGQWAVQGPIALSAAAEAGVPFPRMLLAVAYGDQLTNMLQPFWALPLLGITGVKARDIVGYTAAIMLAVGLWIAFALLVL